MLLCSLALSQAGYAASREEEALQVKGDRLTVLPDSVAKISDDQKNLLTGSSSAWEKPKGVCIPIETIKPTGQVPIATGS